MRFSMRTICRLTRSATFSSTPAGAQRSSGGSAVGVAGGLVPVQELNSLAYAQYLCTIGSDGTHPGNFSYCNTLYQLATPSGRNSADKLAAGNVEYCSLSREQCSADILNFTLTPIPLSGQTGSQQINAGVYVPALTGLGTAGSGGAIDWSVAIYYLTGYGATATGQGSTYPEYVTVDANDNVYFSNPSGSASSAGATSSRSPAPARAFGPATTDTDESDQSERNCRGCRPAISGWRMEAPRQRQAFVQEMDATTGAVDSEAILRRRRRFTE